MKTVFTFWKALPEKVLSSVSQEGRGSDRGSCSLGGCPEGWLLWGGVVICDVGLGKEKGRGTAPPPGTALFCGAFPEAEMFLWPCGRPGRRLWRIFSVDSV